ncbi:MAG: DUF4229 domain-containing protein [Salinibacterium sp.]|nr:DUF4229 domain-containing protein [Salinibacterium sp.]MBF0672113.1 DUF4229 domain-containing protein [Salinibacterium sp.]
MKTSHRWLLYTLLRLGLFAGVFAALMLLGIWWWLSAIFAMVISFSVAYLFFRDTRDQLALDLQQRREKPEVHPDAEAEDAVTDAPGTVAAEGRDESGPEAR